MASSISRENGPCRAKIWDGLSPAAPQASSEAGSGSTRAQQRAAKSGKAANFDNSLLPVVRRMFPSVPDRKRTASSVFSANTASSGASDAPRSSRQCSTPAASQAAAMLLVIDAA